MIDRSRRLATLHAEHLQTVQRRAERALEATGCDGLLIASGSAPYAFRDDQTYPFRANPHFKLWVPLPGLADSYVYFEPGRRPLLLFHSPKDYWHKPAVPPEAYWTGQFDIVTISDPSEARDRLPEDLGRV